MLRQLNIKTNKKQGLIDITGEIKKIILEAGVKEGLCVVYVPHATVGILINENSDLNLCDDIIRKLNDIIPLHDNYEHDEIDNNAHSHIKASIIGPSETIIIKNNKPILGTWQGIALAEFDGPRQRTVLVKIIKD